MKYETIIDWSEDWRDPLPPNVCLLCSKHWLRCGCDPDDPEMHRRIEIERAMRAGDDALAQALTTTPKLTAPRR